MLSKTQKAKRNIVSSLLCQVVVLLCGIYVPRLMIGAFGSVRYGAVVSITGFLAYISLIDAGIGAVSRAALYRILPQGDLVEVSRVVSETKRLFRRIALIFIAYVVVLALIYRRISPDTGMSALYSFLLVLVIGLSTFAEYYFGVSYSILLQADQCMYVRDIIQVLSYLLNVIVIFLLIRLPESPDLLVVKLGSSLVFLLRPLVLSVYTRRKYRLVNVKGNGEHVLKQKRYALGQHIAYTVHNNTDTSVLTVCAGVSFVSVYSVYYMVISKIQSIAASFSGDMEAVFGDYLAKGDLKRLNEVFGYYETLVSLVSIDLFSVTAVMIVPFIALYTADIADVEYLYPGFAVMLTIASVLFCIRQPYGKLILAAGHFKQTQWAGYGEAVINVAVSVLLSLLLPFRAKLLGVAIGTVAATLFRLVFYVRYISKNLCGRPVRYFVKRLLVNAALFSLVFLLGRAVTERVAINGYGSWILAGALVTMISVLVFFAGNFLFYRGDVKMIVRKFLSRGA